MKNNCKEIANYNDNRFNLLPNELIDKIANINISHDILTDINQYTYQQYSSKVQEVLRSS